MFFKFCKKASFSHLPSTFFAPSEHLLNTSRAPFEHLPSTFRAPPEHLPSTSRAPPEHLPDCRARGRAAGRAAVRARGRAAGRAGARKGPKVLPRCPQGASEVPSRCSAGSPGALRAQRCSSPRPEVPRSPRKGATAKHTPSGLPALTSCTIP